MGRPFDISPRGRLEDRDFLLGGVPPALKRTMWSIIHEWSDMCGLVEWKTPAGWFEFYRAGERVIGPLTLAESAAWLQDQMRSQLKTEVTQ